MVLDEYFTLANGNKMPKLGFGTWLIEDSKASDAVKTAITCGYRLIDTAQAYENEVGVGKGIKESGIAREDLFVATKVAAELKTYQQAADSIDKSLNKLGLDYVDQMIIHCPQPWSEYGGQYRYDKENLEVWKALEDAYKAGKVKSIGVSNFNQHDLENIINNCEIKPMINQILLHIKNTDFELVDFCHNNNIVVQAYSPMGHGVSLQDENIKTIADKYNVSIAQLCIRYCIQLDTVALPKASSYDHILANTKLDFTISEQDMSELKSLDPIHTYGQYDMYPAYSKGVKK